jgi:hypothetical protein
LSTAENTPVFGKDNNEKVNPKEESKTTSD